MEECEKACESENNNGEDEDEDEEEDNPQSDDQSVSSHGNRVDLPPTVNVLNTEDVCSQHPLTGPCKSNLKRYYFDQSTSDCKTFVYGGCQGNANRFETREECMSRCQKVRHQALIEVDPREQNNKRGRKFVKKY